MAGNQEFENFRTTVWKTAGARYNAARRFQRRSKFSLMTISIMSGVGVVSPFLLANGSAASNFSAFLAMLVLVVGIVEGSSEFGLRASTLLANAEDLNAFQSRLGVMISSGGASNSNLSDLDAEYQQIKRRTQFNHEPVDLERFVLQHMNAPEFSKADGAPAYGKIRSAWVFLSYGLHSIWWLMLLWAVAVIGFICAWGA